MSHRQDISRSEDTSLYTNESNNAAPPSTKCTIPPPARKRPSWPCTTTSTGSPIHQRDISASPSLQPASNSFSDAPERYSANQPFGTQALSLAYGSPSGLGYNVAALNSGVHPRSHPSDFDYCPISMGPPVTPSRFAGPPAPLHGFPRPHDWVHDSPEKNLDSLYSGIHLSSHAGGYSQNASDTTGASFNSESVLRDMLVQSGGLHAIHSPQANAGQESGYQASMNIPQGYPNVLQPSQSLPAQQTQQGHQAIAPRPVAPGHNALPVSPIALDQLHFKSRDQAQEYLNRPIHYIIPGLWAVPQTDAAMAFYVRKLVRAIANIEDVWDGEDCPWSLLKFQADGECTNPIYVESIAWALVSDALKIHRDGIIGPQFIHASHFKVEAIMDLGATFPQRIDFLAKLLRHSKMAASEVMTRQYVDKYLAMPFTHLMQFPRFVNIWTAMAENERIHRHEILPYPRFSRHFTMAEATKLLENYEERQHHFPSTSSQNQGPDNSGEPSSSGGLGQPAKSPPNGPDTRTSSTFGGPLNHGSPNVEFPAVHPSAFCSSPWGTDAERLFGSEGMGSLSTATGSAPDGGAIQPSIGEPYVGATVQESDAIAFGIADAAQPGHCHIASKSDSDAQQEVSSEVGSTNIAEVDHSRTN